MVLHIGESVSPAHSDCFFFFFGDIIYMSAFYTLNIKTLTFLTRTLGNLPEPLGSVLAPSLGVGGGHSAVPAGAKASAGSDLYIYFISTEKLFNKLYPTKPLHTPSGGAVR